MCIAIYKPMNKLISEEVLRECWRMNPDGGGFMYNENNKLHVVKGLMTIQAFLKAYEEHKEKQCILHFRIATHGGKTQENTHPFFIDKNLAMVHNGIIHKIACDINTKLSDTWHFTEKILKSFRKQNKQFWFDNTYKTLIEDYIGYSKLIFMDNLGNCDIYNEALGIWDEYIWYSNTSYKLPVFQPIEPNNWYNCHNPPKKTTPKWVSSYEKELNNVTSKKHLTDLGVGDYAILSRDVPVIQGPANSPNEMILKGTKIKITSAFNSLKIWVINPINNLQAVLPLWQLELIENLPLPKEEIKVNAEVVFTKHYNHFRVGDIATVWNIEKWTYTITTQGSDKVYKVPKIFVKPFETLMLPNNLE